MAFRSSAIIASSTGGNLSVTPSGVAAGDYLGAVFVEDTSITGVSLAGFTQQGATQTGGPDGQAWRYYDKPSAAGGETITATSSSSRHSALVAGAWSGRNTTTPRTDLQFTAFSAGASSPITAAATGVTAASGDDLALFVIGDQTSSTARWASTPPGSMTERQDGVATDWVSLLALDTQDALSAGATGSLSSTLTLTSGAGQAGWSAVAVSIASAGGGPSAALTGTATSATGEADIVAGGKTILATLSGATWVPAATTGTWTSVAAGTLAAGLNAASLSPALPAGWAAGDLHVLVFSNFGGTGARTPSPPAGWTPPTGSNSHSNGTTLLAVYTRVAQSGDTAPTLSLSGTGNGNDTQLARIHGFRPSAGTVASVDVVGTVSTNASADDIGPISGITPAAGALLLAIAAKSNDFNGQGAITGWTQQALSESTTGNDAGNSVLYQLSAAGTATGTVTVTDNGGTASAGVGLGLLLSFKAQSTPFADALSALIAGLDGDLATGTSWDSVVKPALNAGTVVRTSDTVVTVTLPAVSTYDITSTETVTWTIPSSASTAGAAIVAAPTITITSGPAGIVGTQTTTVGAIGQAAAGVVSVAGAQSHTIGAVVHAASGGVRVAGAQAHTVAAVAQSSAAGVLVAGAQSHTVGVVAQTSAGTVNSGVIGSQSHTVGSVAQVSAAAVLVAGSQSHTVGTVAQASAGAVLVSGAQPHAVGAVSQASAGAVPVSGAQSHTVGAIAQTSAAAVMVSGAQSHAVGAVAQTTAGGVLIAGTQAHTVGAVAQTSAGVVTSGVTGNQSHTVGAVTQTSAGAVPVAGAQASAIGVVAQTSAGAVPVAGAQASSTIGAVGQASAGGVAIAGAQSHTVGGVAQTSAGIVSSGVTGSQSHTVGAVVQASAGAIVVAGVQGTTIGQVVQSFQGSARVAGAQSIVVGAIGQAMGGAVSGGDGVVLIGESGSRIGAVSIDPAAARLGGAYLQVDVMAVGASPIDPAPRRLGSASQRATSRRIG